MPRQDIRWETMTRHSWRLLLFFLIYELLPLHITSTKTRKISYTWFLCDIHKADVDAPKTFELHLIYRSTSEINFGGCLSTDVLMLMTPWNNRERKLCVCSQRMRCSDLTVLYYSDGPGRRYISKALQASCYRGS